MKWYPVYVGVLNHQEIGPANARSNKYKLPSTACFSHAAVQRASHARKTHLMKLIPLREWTLLDQIFGRKFRNSSSTAQPCIELFVCARRVRKLDHLHMWVSQCALSDDFPTYLAHVAPSRATQQPSVDVLRNGSCDTGTIRCYLCEWFSIPVQSAPVWARRRKVDGRCIIKQVGTLNPPRVYKAASSLVASLSRTARFKSPVVRKSSTSLLQSRSLSNAPHPSGPARPHNLRWNHSETIPKG